MRIAYVYDAVYPWVTGGIERRVWALARRLADEHDVHWFGLHHWEGPRVTSREGVTIHGVAPDYDLYVGDRRSIRAALGFAGRLVPAFLGERFDVVDCQTFPFFPSFPIVAHALAGRSSTVLTWHEVWGAYWREHLGLAGYAGQAVERAVARLPATHLAVSRPTADALRPFGPDARVVPNGVDPAAVAAVEPADRDVDVLFAGRLIPEKGVATLVRAMARLEGRSCLVVGEGPERERLEALACGTPVVTTDHPRNAATELVGPDSGVVCDPTPAAVADGIRRARSCSAADCVAAAEAYDWDRVTDRMETVYEEVA